MDIGSLYINKGPGGAIAFFALFVCLISYGLLIRWIAHGAQKDKEPWEEMGWPFK